MSDDVAKQEHPLLPTLRILYIIFAGTRRRTDLVAAESLHRRPPCCEAFIRGVERRAREAVEVLEGRRSVKKARTPFSKWLVAQRREWAETQCPYKHECEPVRRRPRVRRSGVHAKPRAATSRRSMEDRRRQQDLMDEGLL